MQRRAAVLRTGPVMFASPNQHAGHTVQKLHRASLSKNDPSFRAVKQCFDQAALEVFGGHATVQQQGSVSKGTGVRGRSDWDFIVRLTNSIPTVTHAQRMQFLHAAKQRMSMQGISYCHQAGENRIRFYQGSWNGQLLPEVDVCFERFKDNAKAPPNNRAMASSHNGREVVRYIKSLPAKFTNLGEPKSMYLEDLVKKVEQERLPQAARQAGSQGFHALLTASLQAIAQQQYKKILAPARLDDQDWRAVAARVLNKQQVSETWV